MNTPQTINIRAVKRMFCLMLATLLTVATLPLVVGGEASADQLANRSIQMSDSSPSGVISGTTVGSGNNVTYQVSFKTGATSASTAGSLVIDFCLSDPIIGDTCSYPTGMSLTGVALNASAQAGDVDTAHHWSITSTSNGTIAQIKLADDDASGGSDDMNYNTNQIFDITGVTNPSLVGSYYARIYTFHNSNSWGTYSSATSPGNYTDYGGIALSTTEPITISAKVQETLTFCVTAADPNTWETTDTGKCDDGVVAANPPTLTLGHTVGSGSTKVIDDQNVDQGFVWSQLSTNATHGAVINMHDNNTCGGLSADSGATCPVGPINGGTPVSGGSALVKGQTTGVAAFGVNVETYAPSTYSLASLGASGNMTPTSYYYNASHDTVPTDLYYGMDNTTASGAYGTPANTYNGNVGENESTAPYGFGSVVASAAAPVYLADNEYIFGVTAAITTPAGIYTADISLVATGTF